ncbi:MAG: hypothetical protein KTR31_31145 [Myxococcales bacterium]|nr:hypothetical protein [Myxococcales bacterium]
MTDLDRVVAGVRDRLATQGERIATAVRLGFCALVFTRFAGLDADAPGRALQERCAPFESAWMALHQATALGLIAVATAWSLTVAWRSRRGPLPARWLVISVVMDALLCASSLLNNVMDPGSRYDGILSLPDTGAVLLVVVGSALRLRPALVGVALVLNGALLSVLVLVDQGRPEATCLVYGTAEVGLWSVYLSASGAFALIVSIGGTLLGRQTAVATLASEDARRGLSTIARVHHDEASSLEQIRRMLDDIERSTDDHDVSVRVTQASEQMARLRASMRRIQHDARGLELAHSDIEPVSASTFLRSLQLPHYERPPLEGVRVRVAVQDTPRVAVAGGQRAFFMLVWNLLKNAAEGDGVVGASFISLSWEASDGGSLLTIDDDGPGLGEHPRKAGGSGIGLQSVRAIVRHSGGRFELTSSSDGTRARVWLEAS